MDSNDGVTAIRNGDCVLNDGAIQIPCDISSRVQILNLLQSCRSRYLKDIDVDYFIEHLVVFIKILIATLCKLIRSKCLTTGE